MIGRGFLVIALVTATTLPADGQELSRRHREALADSLARLDIGITWAEAPDVTVVTRNAAVIKGRRLSGRNGGASSGWFVAVVGRTQGQWVVAEMFSSARPVPTPMPTPMPTPTPTPTPTPRATPTPTPTPTPSPSPSPSPSPTLSPSPHGISFGGPFRSVEELPVRNGTLRVEAINRRGLAYRAGVRVGDVITAINGELVSHYNKRALFNNLSDRAMRSVEVMRNGQHLEFRF